MTKFKTKSKIKTPEKFTWIQRRILSVCLLIPRIGDFLAKLYIKRWNFINYAIIGGIGVLINYTIFAVTIQYFPWYVCNIIAIGSAMSWNWINSVGKFCDYWGYTPNE